MGKKYIIEIEDVPFTPDSCATCEGNCDSWEDECTNKLYRVKGFKSLVFDEYGLEKLEPYRLEETAKPNEVWPKTISERKFNIGDKVQMLEFAQRYDEEVRGVIVDYGYDTNTKEYTYYVFGYDPFIRRLTVFQFGSKGLKYLGHDDRAISLVDNVVCL